MKKVLVILISFILGICNCSALCSNSKLAESKKEVSNVNYSIDYHHVGDNVYFDIYVNNITENMSFKNNLDDKKYYYSDTNNGEFILKNYDSTQLSITFYGVGECENKKLISKSMKLPIYNIYYKNELCSGLGHLNVCKRWVNSFVGYDNFIGTIEHYNYKETTENKNDKDNIDTNNGYLDSIVGFYVKYYYIILGITIVICVIVMVIYNKKNNFKL